MQVFLKYERSRDSPEAPIIPHKPPDMQPLMLLMIVFACLPRPGLVETETLFQVRTAGASDGATALNTPFSST